VSREVYRRAHANSCLAPDLKAHSSGARGIRPFVVQSSYFENIEYSTIEVHIDAALIARHSLIWVKTKS
jgi:hypothetical protein